MGIRYMNWQMLWRRLQDVGGLVGDRRYNRQYARGAWMGGVSVFILGRLIAFGTHSQVKRCASKFYCCFCFFLFTAVCFIPLLFLQICLAFFWVLCVLTFRVDSLLC